MLKMSLVVGSVAALAIAPSAGAHTGVKSYSPSKGSSVPRSLSAVSVTFDAAIAGGTLTVRNATGRKVSGASRRVSGGRRLRVRLHSGLKAGRYTAKVSWVSGDGHADKTSWSFRLR
jgi:methionine-rich copper-binding protein CopC